MNDCDSQKLCICVKSNCQHGAVGTGKTKVTNVNYMHSMLMGWHYWTYFCIWMGANLARKSLENAVYRCQTSRYTFTL